MTPLCPPHRFGFPHFLRNFRFICPMRERLLGYGSRRAFAPARLSRRPSGTVCYRLRKPHHTGQTEVVFEPVAFLRRLAALVPPARQNQVRYFGLLASRANDHHRLVDLAPRSVGVADPVADADPAATPPRGYRTRWAALLARVFGHQALVCPQCQGSRTILAAITEPEPICTILTHLGLPTDVPGRPTRLRDEEPGRLRPTGASGAQSARARGAGAPPPDLTARGGSRYARHLVHLDRVKPSGRDRHRSGLRLE
jgi:hypothetical protein